MNNINDDAIIHSIENQHFSKLTFLDSCWQSADNKWYLGFYYFIQYLKQAPLGNIIAEATARYGNESSAYCYLGDTARMIYSTPKKRYISAGFYRHAITLNSDNAGAHWRLFIKGDNTKSCLTALTLYYQHQDFEQLGRKIDDLPFYRAHHSRFTDQDWQCIKSLTADSRVPCKPDILVFAFFYLDEVEACLAQIKSMEKVSAEIIETYFNLSFFKTFSSNCIFSMRSEIF